MTADRWNSLRASAAVSQQALTRKTATRIAKQAEVAAAQSNLDRLKALKAFANIIAPFDGVVTARNVDVGSLVKADCDDEPRRCSPSPTFIRCGSTFQCRNPMRPTLKDGMKAKLDLPEYPDRTFDATIATTSHAIDPKSRSLLVELLADNKDGALSPGAFARVHFQLPPDPNAVTLPANALLFRDNAPQVATLGPDNRIVLKKIRIARDLGIRGRNRRRLEPGRAHRRQSAQFDRRGRGGPGHGSRRREDAGGARTASWQEPGDRPKSAEEIAQTGRDHGE